MIKKLTGKQGFKVSNSNDCFKCKNIWLVANLLNKQEVTK